MSKNITSVSLLYKNKLVDNIYEACTCCYDNTKDINYLQKKEYIRKRIDAGHDSVLEHGRLAILITNISKPDKMSDTMGYDFSKYLEFYTSVLEDNSHNMVINGSIRAYKHFITNVTSDIFTNDQIVRQIIQVLLTHTPRELWGRIEDFEMKDFFETNKFLDVESDELDIELNTSGMTYDVVSGAAISGLLSVSQNDIDKIKSVVIGYDEQGILDAAILNKLQLNGFSKEVFDNIIPVMVCFKNMSRTATHQLVRHRNAITQESQRYVSATNASFTIPMENYDDDKQYTISLFNKTYRGSLSTIAHELLNIYGQLIHQGLKKEEARAFLPSNVNCGRLYMTFTISTLKKFIELRSDPHAQYEIRRYALTIKNLLGDYEFLVFN